MLSVIKVSLILVCLSPQLGGRPEGVYEEPESGPVLPGETDDSEPLVTSGDVPAQTGAEDPQVPPAATGDPANTALTTPHTTCYYIQHIEHIHINPTDDSVRSVQQETHSEDVLLVCAVLRADASPPGSL